MSARKENKWVCTDPDTKQYGRKISEGVYEFKEGKGIETIIDLNKYSEEKIRDHISAYYNSLEELKDIYGDDSEWIIAECIFEQECGLY